MFNLCGLKLTMFIEVIQLRWMSGHSFLTWTLTVFIGATQLHRLIVCSLKSWTRRSRYCITI